MSNFAEMLDQLIDAVKEYCKYPDLYMRRNYQDARNGILKSINKLLADVQKVNEISSDYEDRLDDALLRARSINPVHMLLAGVTF